MITLDQPPQLILPVRPAIIRPTVDLQRYFPVELDRNARRAIVKDMLKRGAIEDRAAARVAVEAAIPFGMMFSGDKPPVLTFIDRTADNADLTTYTFSGVAIGPPASDRRVIVVIHSWTRDSSRPLSSATIGGGGTVHVIGHTPSSFNITSSIVSADIASGTTTTIVATHTAGVRGCAIDVFTATGLKNAGATHTNSANATTNGTSIATTINVLEGGFIIAGGGIFISTGLTWPDLTENAEGSYDAGSTMVTMGSASASNLSAQTGRTVTLNCGGANDRRVLAAAAFR